MFILSRRRIRPRNLALAACLASASVAAVAIEGVASGTNVSPCSPPPVLAQLGTEIDVARSESSTGSEITRFFEDGVYVVTRCGTDGRAYISQTVAPMPIPGGDGVVMRRLSEVHRDGNGWVIHSQTLGDPNDPNVIAAWNAHQAEIRAAVISPTPKGS